MERPLSEAFIQRILKRFLASSRSSIDALVRAASAQGKAERDNITLHFYDGTSDREASYDGNCFFLRTSTEYSSPQLTIEELEGLLAARLLEVCVNCRLRHPAGTEASNIDEVAEALRRPPEDKIVPFILETDDIEPDRYSYNPLRNSIIESGQSAFPVANVSTNTLKLDESFVKKYHDSLVSDDETELVNSYLSKTSRYVDFVDGVKREELTRVFNDFGLELRLPQLRMPLDTLAHEQTGGPLHSLIQASHRDYETMESFYALMGRNIKKKTLLPAVPHSPRGYGSKRAAKGKLVFLNGTLATVRVHYQTTSLYPNMIDPNDLSLADCEDSFEVSAGSFTDYSYIETPSSPQFALYALLSPEDGSLWHGVGEYAGNEILRSYASVHSAFLKGQIFKDLKRSRLRENTPVMFNLDPGKMWTHPSHGNIDAGIGCVKDLRALLSQELRAFCITAKLREPMTK
jgi:hypothetical protein